MQKKTLTIQTSIDLPIELVWDTYNTAEDITKWNQASPEWHCPSAYNDLRVGGTFKNRMEAKDGSFGFDFEGEYTEVTLYKSISYKLADDRAVHIYFSENNNNTTIDVEFDPESTNSQEMQEQGWQAILNNFKAYILQKHGR